MNGLRIFFAITLWATSSIAALSHNSLKAKEFLTGNEKSLAIHNENQKYHVLVFLSSECPCSLSHHKVLTELTQKFPNVDFYGLFANTEEDLESAKKFFRENSLPFPVLDDRSQTIANQLGALKTPHAFLVDPKGEVIYKGGVDDSHEAERATKHYLADALGAITRGSLPNPAETRVLGCTISR